MAHIQTINRLVALSNLSFIASIGMEVNRSLLKFHRDCMHRFKRWDFKIMVFLFISYCIYGKNKVSKMSYLMIYSAIVIKI